MPTKYDSKVNSSPIFIMEVNAMRQFFRLADDET